MSSCDSNLVCIKDSQGGSGICYSKYPEGIREGCLARTQTLKEQFPCVAASWDSNVVNALGNYVCEDPIGAGPPGVNWYRDHAADVLMPLCCNMTYQGGYAGGAPDGLPCQKVMCVPGESSETGCYATLEECKTGKY